MQQRAFLARAKPSPEGPTNLFPMLPEHQKLFGSSACASEAGRLNSLVQVFRIFQAYHLDGLVPILVNSSMKKPWSIL